MDKLLHDLGPAAAERSHALSEQSMKRSRRFTILKNPPETALHDRRHGDESRFIRTAEKLGATSKSPDGSLRTNMKQSSAHRIERCRWQVGKGGI